MSDLGLFDKFGKFIATDADYEALPDDQKPEFLAVAEAAHAAELANVEVLDANAALTEAIRKHGIARALRDRLAPRVDATSAAKAWIASQAAAAAAQR